MLPLSIPDTGVNYSTQQLADYDAARLFVERAAAVNSEFQLINENAVLVARICQHLDGIPLAIELAAAYVNVLSLTELAARLRMNITLLSK